MMKKLSLLFLMFFLMCLPLAAAANFDNVKSIDLTRGEYGIIRIENWFGIGKTLVEYELHNYDSSLINAWAEGRVTLYEQGRMFTGIEFKNKLGNLEQIKNIKFYYEVTEERNYTHYIYPECKSQDIYECAKIKSNGSEIRYYNVTYWKEYYGEILKQGTYKWRIEGERGVNQRVDFILITDFGAKKLTEWAWWDASWDKKQAIYLNSTNGNLNKTSVLINVNYDSDMQADFDDLRFTDEAETTELGYWFNNNSYIDSTNVSVWVNIGSINSTTNRTIYMYYDNAGASTTSNIDQAFWFGDNFNGSAVNWANKWYSNDQSKYSVSSGELLATVPGNANDGIYSNLTFQDGWVSVLRAKTDQVGNDGLYLSFADQQHGVFQGYDKVGTTTGTVFRTSMGGDTTGGTPAANTYYLFKGTIPATGDGLANVTNENGLTLHSKTGTPSDRSGIQNLLRWSSGTLYVDWIYINRYVPNPITYTFGSEEAGAGVDNPPTATINAPADNYNSTEFDVYFNCTASDDQNITNITLWIDNVANYTEVHGISNKSELNVTLTLIDGTYNVSCSAFDNATQIGWSSNRTLNIVATDPVLTQALNLSTFSTDSFPFAWDLDYNASDETLQACWYFTSDSFSNVSFTCNTSTTINWNDAGTKTIYYFANDSWGNEGSRDDQITITSITENATYETNVLEDTSTNINLELWTTDNITGFNGTLTYNQTIYTPSLYNNDTYATLNTTLTTPNVDNDTAINFFWNYTINGKNYTSATYQHNVTNVAPIGVSANCTDGLDSALRFIFQDSETLSALAADIAFNFRYGVADPTSEQSYGNLTNVYEFNLCINSSVSTNYTLSYGEIQYSRNQYTTRRFYIYNGSTMSNETTNYTLYMINNSEASSFLFEVEEEGSLDPYPDKYVSLLRWYPSLDEYKVVEMAKTDEKGESVLRVNTEDVDYRTGIYEVNGSLIYLASPVRFICIDSPCTYTLRISPEDVDYTSFLNIVYLFNYNETSKIWSFTFSDSSQRTTLMNLSVYKVTGTSEYVVCQDSVSAYSGVLSCNTSAYSGTLKGIVQRSASPPIPIAQKLIQATQTAFRSTFGLFLSLMIGIPIAVVLALISPVAAVIGAVVALIPALYFKSIGISVVLGVAILAAIVIHFMRRVN